MSHTPYHSVCGSVCRSVYRSAGRNRLAEVEVRVNPRNFFGRSSLEADMDELSHGSVLPLTGLEGALPGIETRAERAMTISAEEAALVTRARAGDQDAFGVLVRLHQRQVYNLALRILRDNEEAYEATQEVFLAAWQGVQSFRGQARFATWLYRIAYNYCLRVTESRRRDAAARAELLAQSARAQRPEQRISAEHARHAEQELREAVRTEIACLPAKYRSVLVLRHLQELSYEEMAQVMRVPIGTVKTQLFRARALLKERLQHLDQARTQGMARAGELRAGLEAGLRTILERAREQAQEGDER
jgi:RNA polymerase sigma-70 factor (ECF subfamily)